MQNSKNLISDAFLMFKEKAPNHAAAWGRLVQELSKASSLDAKVNQLIYIAVLAALGLESGLPFHVQAALDSGSSPEEIISAALVGLPAAGVGVIKALPAIIRTIEKK
jgi:alkylhydroperoxidase/carboxymuconolactone decarboxylase family protein YurZ